MTQEADRGESGDKRFHEDAKELLTQHLREQGGELMQISLALARRRHHPLVQPADVRDAKLIQSRRSRNLKTLVLQVPSAALVGAFLHGFSLEMAAPEPQTVSLIAYVLVGLLGGLGVFFSMLR